MTKQEGTQVLFCLLCWWLGSSYRDDNLNVRDVTIVLRYTVVMSTSGTVSLQSLWVRYVRKLLCVNNCLVPWTSLTYQLV